MLLSGPAHDFTELSRVELELGVQQTAVQDGSGDLLK